MKQRGVAGLSTDISVSVAKVAREALWVKGPFWTPAWGADAMAAYALGRGSRILFDPGVGAGALLRAGRRIGGGPDVKLCGREIDPEAWRAANDSGLMASDMAGIELSDFLLNPPTLRYDAIMANPPYVRHHRLSAEAKLKLHTFAR